jgi:hypothetical protein
MRRCRRCCLALILASLAALDASGVQARRHISPQALVLRSRDMPASLEMTSGSAVQYGYQTTFLRHASTGIINLEDVVAGTPKGMTGHRFYTRAVRSLKTSYNHKICYDFPPVFVGVEHVALVCNVSLHGYHTTDEYILFRRGSYIVQLIVLANIYGFVPGQALYFAQILDKRIKRAS